MANDKIFNVEMPQMGESITEATILKWLKSPGDSLAEGDLLLEISTEKVTAEIPAPVAGTLVECLFPADSTVPVETVIARIAPAGVAAEVKRAIGGAPSAKPVEAATSSAPANAPAPVAAKPVAAPAPSAPPSGAPAKRHFSARPSAADVIGPIARRQGPAEDAAVESARADQLRKRSTPLVRNIAADLNVDLSRVAGSGAHGRVTKKDLVAFLESTDQAAAAAPAASSAVAKPAAPASPAAASSLPPGISPVHFNGGDEKREPLSRMRRLIARHMVESVHTSPHAYTVFEVDMTRVQKLRESVRKRYHNEHGVRLTPLAFIVAAIAEALPRYPTLNASIEGDNVVYHRHVNMGVAVALGDEGLIVPVVKQVENLSLLGIARALNDIADRARTKRLTIEDTKGGTFTITSPGQLGAVMGTPIINQPQSAILHVGAIAKQPAVVEGTDGEDVIAIRSKAWLTLGLDHRLIDGWLADTFMAAVRDRLEKGDFQLA